MRLEYRGDLQENHTLWVPWTWKNCYPSVKEGSGGGGIRTGGCPWPGVFGKWTRLSGRMHTVGQLAGSKVIFGVDLDYGAVFNAKARVESWFCSSKGLLNTCYFKITGSDMRTRALGPISFCKKAKLEGCNVGEAGRPVSRLRSGKSEKSWERPRRGWRVGCPTARLEFLRHIVPWRDSWIFFDLFR